MLFHKWGKVALQASVSNQISIKINEQDNLYQLSLNVYFKRYLKLEICSEIYIKCKSKRRKKGERGKPVSDQLRLAEAKRKVSLENGSKEAFS